MLRTRLILILVMICTTGCAAGAPTPMPTSIVVQKPTYAVQRGEVVRDEVLLREQVLGRVARECELRDERQVGAGTRGPGHGIEHARGVALDVADHCIDLCEREPHLPSQPRYG